MKSRHVITSHEEPLHPSCTKDLINYQRQEQMHSSRRYHFVTLRKFSRHTEITILLGDDDDDDEMSLGGILHGQDRSCTFRDVQDMAMTTNRIRSSI